MSQENVEIAERAIDAYNRSPSVRSARGHVEQRRGWLFLWAQGTLAAYLDIDDARAAAERLADERAQADV